MLPVAVVVVVGLRVDGCGEGIVVAGVVAVGERHLLGHAVGPVEERHLLGLVVGVVDVVGLGVSGVAVLEEQEEVDLAAHCLYHDVLMVETQAHSSAFCCCFEGLILRGREEYCTSCLVYINWLSRFFYSADQIKVPAAE